LNYYVYYKLDPQAVPAARSRVNELFEKIQKQFGVKGRWMRRRDDPTTYMEVYEGVKDEAAFEAVMETEGPRVAPNRRLERFVSA
jgi:hypothetical protein